MFDKNDLGVRQGGGEYPDTEDYDVTLMSDLPNDDDVLCEIEGDIFITELKTSEKGNKYFTLFVNDHNQKEKWIMTFYPTLYDLEDAEKPTRFYGKKAGKVYTLVDSFMHSAFGDEEGEAEAWNIEFEKFRETINTKVGNVKMVSVPNPHKLAESGMPKFVKVEKLDS